MVSGGEITRRRRRVMRGPIDSLRAMAYASPLYRLTLGGRQPEQLAQAPTDPWPGDSERARQIMKGSWRFAGQTLNFPGKAGTVDWYPAEAWDGWLAELHGFQWLRDLRELGGEARGAARHACANWMAQCGSWERFGWRPDILGRRLVAWLTHGGFLLNGADILFRRRFLQSLAEQTRHLARVVSHGPEGIGRIAAVKALLYAGLTLPGSERRLPQGLRLLEHELERQTLPDGGQVERNASVQFQLMRDLVEIRLALISAKQSVPNWLQLAIDRTAPMLRFYRHGDGGLVLFNGSSEENPDLIDNVLALGQATGKPTSRAAQTGYERMVAKRSLLVVDAGPPPPAELAEHAHAGPLSFEMSVGRERLIVNVGSYDGPDAAWRMACRATAAHSTLSVDDRNSVEIRDDGSLGRVPKTIDVERDEQDGATWLSLSHDGYKASCRLIHCRRLYLSAEGNDLRGEDTLVGPGGEQFTLRFHLHPDVQAAAVQDGVLIRLASGEGWRFRAQGGVVSLANSVYLGSGTMRRSSQIVVSGGLNGETTSIKWALACLPKEKKARRKKAVAEEEV
jgi:uncharacterized heparinase superfamily protein